MRHDELDNRIAAAVQAEEAEIPAEVRRKARLRMEEGPSPRRRAWLWRPLPWATAAAAALLAVLLLSPERPSPPEGAERLPIRTEFSLPEKNLTIVWVTSADFRLGSFRD